MTAKRTSRTSLGLGEHDLDAITLMMGLYGLWASKAICQDAFFLGAQVCNRLQKADARQVTMDGEEAQTQYVVLDGSLYSGPLTDDLHTYVEALQDLHFRGGLLNDIVEPGESIEDMSYHFTSDSEFILSKHLNFKTPIHFKIVPMSRKTFLKCANKLIVNKIEGLEKLEF